MDNVQMKSLLKIVLILMLMDYVRNV